MSSSLPQSIFSDPVIYRSFKGNTDKIRACLFNPNMQQAFTGSEDGNIFVWNFLPNSRPYKFIGHKGSINSLSVSPLGNIIASGSSDCTVRLWSNTLNGSSQLLKPHNNSVNSVDFTNDSRLLLSASSDKTIKIFSLSEKKFLQSYIYPKFSKLILYLNF